MENRRGWQWVGEGGGERWHGQMGSTLGQMRLLLQEHITEVVALHLG